MTLLIPAVVVGAIVSAVVALYMLNGRDRQ
jgi:hypothetical protein